MANRYHPPMDVPDMVLIFDQDDQVIGLQSGAPEVDFVSGDCAKNEFYVKDTIVGKQVGIILIRIEIRKK